MKYIGPFDTDPLDRKFINGYTEFVYEYGLMPGAMEHAVRDWAELFDEDNSITTFVDKDGRIWTRQCTGRWTVNKLHPELWQ